jgi:hypothetical protein
MAKQLVNPIERHAEKAVVAITALLLLGAVAKYVISTPNRMDLGGTSVTPTSIDGAVAQAAAAARDRIRNARADEPVPEPLFDEFITLLDPYGGAKLSLTLARVVPLGPEVPTIDPPEDVGVVSQLPRVVPFRAAGVSHGRTTFKLESTSGVRHLPTNWVTVSAVFDVKGQMNELTQKYGVLNKQVQLGMPEVERREQRPDGSWSDDDWRPIAAWRPIERIPLREAPPIVLAESGDSVVVSQNSRTDFTKFVEFISPLPYQREIIRPLVPPQVNGDVWSFPILTDRRDVLLQDDYMQFADKPAALEPMDIYGTAPSAQPIAKVELSRAEQIQQSFKEAEALVESAQKNLVVNDAIRAQNLMFEVENDPQAGSSEKTRAKRIKERAAVVENDVRRALLTRPGAGAREADAPEQATKREPLPIQQIWVHDAAEGSVKSGRNYQYRIRAAILNTLAAQPEKFSKPENAAVAWFVGDWSEAIDVHVPEHLRVFLTGEDKRDNAIYAEFFQWFNGAWVKSRRFKAAVGDALADRQVIEVPSDIDPKSAARATVDFDAAQAVIDIDFDRPLRERRRGDSRTGVKFGDARTETAIVTVDESGRLVERFVATDKADDDRKALAASLFSP